MYYLCSENKGADQLRGYREADLRLCFRICKKTVFSQRGSYTEMKNKSKDVCFYSNIFRLDKLHTINIKHNVRPVFAVASLYMSKY